MPKQTNDVRPSEPRTNDPANGDSAPVLKKRASDFGRRGVVLLESSCTSTTSCCCSCLHIVGAFIGAVIGLHRGLAQVKGSSTENVNPPQLPPKSTGSTAPQPFPTILQPMRDPRSKPDTSFSPGLVFLGLATVAVIVSITLFTINAFTSSTDPSEMSSEQSLMQLLGPLLTVALLAPSVLLIPICVAVVAYIHIFSSRETVDAKLKAAVRVSWVTLGYSFVGMILGWLVMLLFLGVAMLLFN